jgi:ribosomal protein L37AE/L43A
LFLEHRALLKRLPEVHEKSGGILEDIWKMEAGVRGEDRVLLKLHELRMPGPFKVYSDIRLHLGEWKVQIDCLYFESDSEEFYKVDQKGEEIPYPNPYYQLMRHIRFMKEFLHQINPEMKVTGSVFMTAKSCRIRKKPAKYPIFKLESIIEKVMQMYHNSPPLALLESQLVEIEQIIMSKQSTFTYAPLCERYQISPIELKTGVECPGCGALGMKRVATTWTCLCCKQNHRYAHISTVNEYFWLIKKEITNREFRKFCGLESIYSASRMLSKMDLAAHGNGSGRYYTRRKD